jgi:queuine tRNA-ribosyltransferase
VVLPPKFEVNTRPVSRLQFKIEGRSPGSEARAGSFTTLHGEVQTPIFMPVGTQATVKSQTVESLKEAGSRVLLANTYHLLLRPGAEVFRRFGGIHRFMNWDGPVLTDSGGFQIFSLPHSRQMNEEGAHFQSYLDGKTHLLSPEESIGMQKAIGSDIMMALDQCIRSTAGKEEAIAAMELTHRWAKRSLDARGDSPQAMFGIVQGACYSDLRRKSAEFLNVLPFDGYAIGGLAVGETKEQREEFCGLTAKLLPKHLPRYLMGVGTPLDILEAVHRGVDMFDCIIPSQIAQRGGAFTSMGRLQLRRGSYKFSEEALDPDCACPTCKSYSKAYLHHLYKTGEHLGWTLITQHNLTFYHRLMREIRAHILAGTFLPFYESRREQLALSDNEYDGPSQPSKPPKKKRSWQLGDYDIFANTKGFHSIRQISSGEIMHSVTEPTEEAHSLYISQSNLAARLVEPIDEPLTVWDVGLGAATNAMSAVRCYEELKKSGVTVRPLRMISFETDLDPLRLALKHPGYFSHLRHGAPHSVLKTGRYDADGLEWTLIPGDFAATFETAVFPPDLIYYDMFSAKTNAHLWTPEHFARLFAFCAPKPAEIYTYSASTAVRAALLSVGFYVAPGIPTGPKAETTVAYSRPAKTKLLGAEWLDRWKRSHVRFPAGLEEKHHPHFESRILSHPQFVD